MASYLIHSYQTLNLPQVNEDTFFVIHRYPTQDPDAPSANIIYRGMIVAGYRLLHVEEILSQYVWTEDLTATAAVGDHVIQDDEQRFTFYLYMTTDDWNTFTTDTITIIYDWSYERDPRDIMTTKSTIPITLMDYRQCAVQSMMSRDGQEESIQVTIDTETIDNFVIDGNSTWTYFRWLNDGSITWRGEFSRDYSYDFFVESLTPPTGTLNEITIAGIRYQVEQTCYNYCLYYLNAYGGYDYMLFAGKELQTDNLTRFSYKQTYDALSSQFGQVDYQTTIKETWSLNTSWMTDTQAYKLRHLFSSNKMWLQDLTASGKSPYLIPVNIVNTSYEHKNWRNQDRKLYSYTIELQASQTKYRV